MSVNHSDPYKHYLENQVDSAGAAELLLMLYSGALNFLRRARIAVENNEVQEANNLIGRVQDIIVELMGSLDIESGELALKLFNLYEYMHRQLVQANLKKEVSYLDEVESMISSLKYSWEESQVGAEETVKLKKYTEIIDREC